MTTIDPKLKDAIVKALDGHTRFSRDCNLTGEYLASLVVPLIEALPVSAEPVDWEDAAKIADKVAEEYARAEEGTFRAGVHRAAVMIARRIRSKQVPYYGSRVPSPPHAGVSVTDEMVEAALSVWSEVAWKTIQAHLEKRGVSDPATAMRAALAAALSRSPAPSEAVEAVERETAWVIENDLPAIPTYFCGGKGGKSFSPDHMAAVRFIRREDAVACADFFPLSQAIHAEVREHVWLTPPADDVRS